MSLFGQYYVKTGKFSADEAWLYTELQSLREKSDYNCVYVTTEEEMRPLIEPLKAFIAKGRRHDKGEGIRFPRYI